MIAKWSSKRFTKRRLASDQDKILVNSAPGEFGTFIQIAVYCHLHGIKHILVPSAEFTRCRVDLYPPRPCLIREGLNAFGNLCISIFINKKMKKKKKPSCLPHQYWLYVPTFIHIAG
jgi:hypothetical protein